MSEPVYAGKGIIFAVYDWYHDKFHGPKSTITLVADAIEEALDHGHDDPDSIARYLLTTTYQHLPDRQSRFNSILKAGNAVGARIIPKLHNAYEDLCKLSREGTKKERELAAAEARGFAEAITIMYSPFSVEDENDKNQVNWDEVDSLTDLMQDQHEESKGR